MGMPVSGQPVRSDTPVSLWSQNWLAYTRFDGIVLTREDVHEMEAGDNNARAALQAIWQYVEAGGSLLVLGPGTVNVPATWKRTESNRAGFKHYYVGFGQCLVSPERDSLKWNEDHWAALSSAWSSSGMPFQTQRDLVEMNNLFPVVDDLGVPVRGLFALMLLFGIAIGPVNLVVLSRKNRRIWMLWTVPVMSALTCLAVFGYMIVAEGWQGHANVSGITLLDEAGKRATTIGRSAYYSPLTPADGLRFGAQTEVLVQGREHPAHTSACALDWTEGQHLSRGWVTARVPAHFSMRKCEGRHERLLVDRQPDGTLSVRNALGVDVRDVWLADEKSRLYHGGPIPAGQSATLQRSGDRTASAAWPGEPWRRLYSGTDWTMAINTLSKTPRDYLGPKTYLAVMAGTPFLEQGLKGAHVRESPSIVVGLLAEIGKGK
jgi:hypothetical protein